MQETRKDAPEQATAPRQPEPGEFGLAESDLERMTLRRILLMDEWPTVGIVVVTALAIWQFGWWGIAVAVASLALFYGIRVAAERWVWTAHDRTVRDYHSAMEAYRRARREYDNAVDAREMTQSRDA